MKNLTKIIKKFPRIKYNYVKIGNVLYFTTSLDEKSFMTGIYLFIQTGVPDNYRYDGKNLHKLVREFSIRAYDGPFDVLEKTRTVSKVFAYFSKEGGETYAKTKFVTIHLVNGNYENMNLDKVGNRLSVNEIQAGF